MSDEAGSFWGKLRPANPWASWCSLLPLDFETPAPALTSCEWLPVSHRIGVALSHGPGHPLHRHSLKAAAIACGVGSAQDGTRPGWARLCLPLHSLPNRAGLPSLPLLCAGSKTEHRPAVLDWAALAPGVVEVIKVTQTAWISNPSLP